MPLFMAYLPRNSNCMHDKKKGLRMQSVLNLLRLQRHERYVKLMSTVLGDS